MGLLEGGDQLCFKYNCRHQLSHPSQSLYFVFSVWPELGWVERITLNIPHTSEFLGIFRTGSRSHLTDSVCPWHKAPLLLHCSVPTGTADPLMFDLWHFIHFASDSNDNDSQYESKNPQKLVKNQARWRGKNKTWILKICHWQNCRCRMRIEGRKILSNSRVNILRPQEASENQQSWRWNSSGVGTCTVCSHFLWKWGPSIFDIDPKLFTDSKKPQWRQRGQESISLFLSWMPTYCFHAAVKTSFMHLLDFSLAHSSWFILLCSELLEYPARSPHTQTHCCPSLHHSVFVQLIFTEIKFLPCKIAESNCFGES